MQRAVKCHIKLQIWLFYAAVSFGSPLFASEPHGFSASNSSLEFSVQVLGVLKKRGQFTDFEGQLIRQPGSPENALVWLSIRSGSAQMRSRRDTDMVKGEDFFAADQFPEVRFESELFNAQLLLNKQTSHPITGYLRLRGKRLPETLSLTVLNCVALAALKDCSFQVEGKLDRARYGMQSHRSFVSNDVRLSLTIHSKKQGETVTVQGDGR